MTDSDFILTAKDKTAAAFNAVANRLNDLNDKANSVGKAMSTVGKVFGIAAGAAGVGMLAKAAFDAGNAMNKIDASKIMLANQATDKAKASLANMAAIIGAKLAPFVEALANWFTKAMGDGKGFGEVVGKVFNGLVTVVGVFADAWRGIEVIWAGLKIVFQGFGLAVLEGLAAIDRTIVDMGNKLPGVSMKYSATIQGMATAAGQSMVGMQADLATLLAKPLPSAGIKAFVAETESAANAHAATVTYISDEEKKRLEKAAEERRKLAEKQREELEKHTSDYMNALTKELSAIDQRNMSAAEKMEQGFQQERDALNTARANNIIDMETYEAQKLGVEQRYAKERSALKQQELGQFAWFEKVKSDLELKTTKGRISAAQTILGQASGLMQSDRKNEFEFGKKAAIGQALIGTSVGVTEALKAPWWLSPGLVALALATGMMQVRSIRRTQFGGGGAANVGATATMGVGSTGLPDIAGAQPESNFAPAPTLPQSSSSSAPQRNITFVVESGNAMLNTWIRESFAPAAREAFGDGVRFTTETG